MLASVLTSFIGFWISEFSGFVTDPDALFLWLIRSVGFSMIRKLISDISGLFAGRQSAEHVDLSQMDPTPEMVEEAKSHRGGWLYAIKGSYGPSDAVPPEAIAGAWKVDDDGKIVPGSFVANPNYKQVMR